METRAALVNLWVLADDGRLYRNPVWGGTCRGLGFGAAVMESTLKAMAEKADALGPAPDGAWPCWEHLYVNLAVESPGPARAWDVGHAARELVPTLFGPAARLVAGIRRVRCPRTGADFTNFTVRLDGPPPADRLSGSQGVSRTPWGRPFLVADFGRPWG